MIFERSLLLVGAQKYFCPKAQGIL